MTSKNKSRTLTVLGLGMLGSATVGLSQTTETGESLKLESPDPAPSDRYGSSVAIWGDHAIIGERLDSQQSPSGGAAFAYRRSASGWVLTERLTPSDPTPAGQFGGRVWLHENVAIVHAADVANNAGGALYLFERNVVGWQQTQKLVPLIQQSTQNFGFSASLQGDTLLVGVPHRSTGAGPQAGVVLHFENTNAGWTEIGEIRPNNPDPIGCFGSAVDLDGNLVAIGAYAFGPEPGAGFVFERFGNSWVQQVVLRPDTGDPTNDSNYGRSIALDGDTLCIGRPARGGPFGDPPGSVHVYQPDVNGHWTQVQRLLASDGSLRNWFGESISLQGNTIVVGAPLQDGLAADAGAAYVFRRAAIQWEETSKLVASDADQADDRLGATVSADNGTVLCSAHFDNLAAGSVYVYQLPIGVDFCTPSPTSSGSPARQFARGSQRVADDDLTLLATFIPANEFGYFLASRTQSAPFSPPGSSGSLCLAANIGRFHAASQIIQGPTGTLSVPLDSVPVTPTAAIQPGDTWNFQCWFRDAGSSNFTNAVSIAFH